MPEAFLWKVRLLHILFPDDSCPWSSLVLLQSWLELSPRKKLDDFLLLSLSLALSLSRPRSVSKLPARLVSWTCCRFNINPASALTYIWGWNRGLWIGSHFQNESLDLATEHNFSAELLPLHSPHPSSFFIHVEFLVTVDSCAGRLVIYVLLCKDKGSTELERWKATPCTYTEVCNAAAPHSPRHSASPVLQKGSLHISSEHHLESRSIKESLDYGSQKLKEGKVSEHDLA